MSGLVCHRLHVVMPIHMNNWTISGTLEEPPEEHRAPTEKAAADRQGMGLVKSTPARMVNTNEKEIRDSGAPRARRRG